MSKLEIRNEEMALGASSLPYPEPAIRLIRQDKIDEFNRRMTELRQDLDEAVAQLDAVAGLRPSHLPRPKVSRQHWRPDGRRFCGVGQGSSRTTVGGTAGKSV